MAHNTEDESKLIEETVAVFERNAGNIRASAAELGVSRSTIRRRVGKRGKGKKPLASGSIHGTKTKQHLLPEEGKIKRYILTSAQNNTHVHDEVWNSLLGLAKHYDAEILVGTYSYNQNRFSNPQSVKRGTAKVADKELWYDPKVLPYVSDERRALAPGLVWCGEMNILPTAVSPLTGMESYTARKSAIFPHAKQAMRSVPTMQGEGTKLNYTTGTVTQRNYIQKREGLIAEHHHVYGAVIVEVNSSGNWWVRQLNADKTGLIQDLDVVAKGDTVTTGNRIEAVTWGDLHAAAADHLVLVAATEILDTLRPKYQFLHDVLEGASISHHTKDNPHAKFYNWLRGLSKFSAELQITAGTMEQFDRPGVKTVVVDANHDDPWIQRWFREYDYRKDPANAEIFLEGQRYLYAQLRTGKMPRDINMLEWALKHVGLKAKMKFLVADESYLICNKKIECGMHGHLGPAGRFGSPQNLAAMGRKANTAHTHSAGIYNGLYVAGTSTNLRWDYNKGPSSWTNSHILTYPNGKRTIVTLYKGQWRAQ